MTRVLIVDDRRINRLALATLLADVGIETREASDGRGGLEIVREWPADLVIVDIDMPVLNGREFVRALHSDATLGATPIVLYAAGYEIAKAERIAIEYGVRYRLIKPSDPELILATMDRALNATARSPSEAATELLRLHSEPIRMAALIDFGLQMGAMVNPAEIAEVLAHAIRAIVPSARAEVTVVAGGRTTTEFLSEASETIPADAEGATLRVPIETAAAGYGWISVSGRVGGGNYSRAEVAMVEMMAAQTAVACEGLVRYEAVAGSVDRIARTMGHQFNNVLMSIQPFAEVIGKRAGDDAKLQQAATHIVNAVNRGKEITREIMTPTKPIS